jgi:hypothetical protein
MSETDEEVTNWPEDDNPESLIGEGAEDDDA